MRPRAILPAILLAAACSRCDSPSASVDAGDLHGVFDEPSASVSAASRTAGPSASAQPPPALRAPGDVGCTAERGQPAPVKRTIGRPVCRAAEILEWRDPTGAPRYACLYAPPNLEKRGPLPLLVYFHGSSPGLDDPASLPKQTSLRSKMAAFEMTGDADRRGFMMLAVQGRALGQSGAAFDAAHVSAENVDKVTADAFVDILRSRGVVDDKRVYAFGVGRGAEMAVTYAMLRPDRIAAFAGYAPPPPVASWQCPGPPPPGLVLYRACDAVVACDTVETWLRKRDEAGAETKALRLGEDTKEEPNCTPKNKCSKKKGEAHHHRWPKRREEDMLRFFAGHALK